MAAVLPTPVSAQAISGLARALIQAGKITAVQAEALQKKAATEKLQFIDMLISSGTLSGAVLATFCSDTFGYPIMDMAAFSVDLLPVGVIDAKLMQSQRVIALAKRGNKMSVAISDPTNTQALDQIKFQSESSVEPVIVAHDVLLALLANLNKSTEQKISDMVGDDEDIQFDEGPTTVAQVDTGANEIEDAPIVKFLNKILMDAVNLGASDIHFEPFEKFYRIRLRVDGVLREHAQPPVSVRDKLVSRIKVLSKLDISEKRVPQDGRMRLILTATKAIDFRVSTCPTLFGEKTVMRILDATQAQMGIDALGYDPDQ
ncbi:MAG: ATPase, T2SS/T4P/T4SS family, partial [Pseudomonadota bacterium]